MQWTSVAVGLMGPSFLTLAASYGQGSGKFEFEAASLRASSPRYPSQERPLDGVQGGGPGTSDPGRITYSRVPLDRIIADAFGLRWDQISGPDWILSQRYDIVANVSNGSTQEEGRQMLRNLLAERLRLAAHSETKILAGYNLLLAPGGPKLQESVADQGAAGPPPQPSSSVEADGDGFPILPAGVHQGTRMAPGRTLARFSDSPISEFALWLGVRLGTPVLSGSYSRTAPAPVVDMTGLMGRYDFTFWYAGFVLSVPTTVPLNVRAIQDALEKQLGLKLVAARVPRDILVIDHVEKKPTEN